MSNTEAREFSDAQVTGPVIELTLEQLLVYPEKNLRQFEPNIEEVKQLADSIRQRNWVSPLLVTRRAEVGDDEIGPYELVAGYQRVRALQLLKDEGVELPTIPAQVIDVDPDDNMGTMLFNLAENAQRTNFGHIDAGYAVKKMLDAGMSAADIAKKIGKGVAWVRVVLSFLRLTPDKQKLVQSGAIPFKVARTLPAMEPAEQDKVIAALQTGKSASEIVESAAQVNRVKKAGKKKKGKKKKGDVAAASEGESATTPSAAIAYISSKAAILEFEGQIEKMRAEAENGKLDSAQEWTVRIYQNLIQFLQGKKGIRALHRVISGS